MQKRQLRVLMILPTLKYSGGMESFFMNQLRNINKNEILFDVFTHEISADRYVQEIEEMGGHVYKAPAFSIGNFAEIKKTYIRVLQSNHYDIVHCNMANASFLYLREAKKSGVPVRIQHSHQDRAADTRINAIRNIPLLFIGNLYANTRIACSKNAGDFLFGKMPYIIIRNSIDYDAYKWKPEIGIEIKKELGIEADELVVGHTGRLTPQKNQLFLLEVFAKLHNKVKAKLLLIGDGPDQALIEKRIGERGIDEHVLMLGERNDISDLLQGMDVFIFPSLYEGLGISLLEAQAAGLPCFCSDAVPEDAKICDNLYYLSLNRDANFWAESILNKLKDFSRDTVLLDPKYDSKANSDRLKEVYLRSMENHL